MDYILNRRSVRKYDLTKKLTYEELYDLCKYAESAPTARRQKSRSYIIVDDQNLINELSKVSKGSMILSECNSLICVVGNNPDNLATPHMQAQDLSAATQNILLRATSLNIGSCWIGIYPLEDRMDGVRKILKLEGSEFPFSLIALGYPLDSDKAFFDANKLEDSMIHYNRW